MALSVLERHQEAPAQADVLFDGLEIQEEMAPCLELTERQGRALLRQPRALLPPLELEQRYQMLEPPFVSCHGEDRSWTARAGWTGIVLPRSLPRT